MSRVRLIGRLDIKGPNLIKSINFEGLRVIGVPQDFAKRYYSQGIDEIIFMDCVASLYGRNSLNEIIAAVASDIFVPITVGGGVRSVEDAFQLFRSGADKVAINTAAVSRPQLITEISSTFGSQSTVLSVEAKNVRPGEWEVYTDSGREKTGLDVLQWVKRGVLLGAGEVLVTSVDREGTRKGCDIELVRAVTEAVDVPVIASGGVGNAADVIEVVSKGGADAVAMADILHYGRETIESIRTCMLGAGLQVRNYMYE